MSSELKGSYVLAAFLVFFGITIAVNIVMATYAVSTFSGEDVSRPYLRGLEYNKTLAARSAQQASGWTASISLARDGAAGAAVSVVIKGKDGAGRGGLSVEATLRRPTDAALDRTVKLEGAGNGEYRARLDNLASGQWDVIARDADSDGTPFEAERRVLLP